MPRQRRVYEPGLSLHVIQRGNNGGDIFAATADYLRRLTLIGDASRRERVDIHGFVLMTTHFHLLVTTQGEKTLARFMQRVNGQYAQYYNRQHGRIGTVWNGRYRGILIRDERQWLTCLRYIDQNPVRAHMVETADRYRWSSYLAHASGGSWPGWAQAASMLLAARTKSGRAAGRLSRHLRNFAHRQRAATPAQAVATRGTAPRV